MIDLFYLVVGIGFLFSLAMQGWLRTTYGRWSRVRNSLDLPGAQVARYLLDQNGLSQNPVEIRPGNLTDHYDPRTKTVALSEKIYREPSVASAATSSRVTTGCRCPPLISWVNKSDIHTKGYSTHISTSMDGARTRRSSPIL